MIKITLNNYEAHYLDYLEGTLPTEDVAALLLFLEQHPQLKVDFDSIENLVLSEDSICYLDKSSLKNFSRAEQLMIGSVEGINSTEENIELNEMVAGSNVLDKNLKLYQKTILKVDTIQFPNKTNLKRSKGIVAYLYPMFAVAATITILISVFNFSFTSDVSLSNTSDVSDNNMEMKTPIIEDTVSTIDSTFKNNSFYGMNMSALPQKNNKKQTFKANLPTTVMLNTDTDSLLSNDLVPKATNEENKKIENVDSVANLVIDQPIVDFVADNSIQNSKEITLKQFLSNKVRKKVFKEDEPTFDDITGNEVMTNIASGLSNVTKKEVVYVQSSVDQKDVVSFSIGKFEFYRSKTK
jgi:hypothetical protein